MPDKPCIAVLPFVNMSEDPKQEYFSGGLTEDLITDLSKFSNLFVIARNSVFTYKGKAVKVAEVGREPGVRYVLEGSVRKAEGLAPGGSVVVSEHTYKLTEGYFEFKPLGAARVKGVSEPVNIYEVLGVGPLRTRL